jgi:hypothetical protein
MSVYYEPKRCITISYSSSIKYKRVYIPSYVPLSTNTWSFLMEQHRVNPGCICYSELDLIRCDHVKLTRSTSIDNLSRLIQIPRTKTLYKIDLLFDNAKKR